MATQLHRSNQVMHEATIASGILEIVSRVAVEHGPDVRVRTVRVRVGAFTGVAYEALEFAFEALKEGTVSAGAVLEIERVPVMAGCSDCRWTGSPGDEFCLACPSCEGPLTILSGRELEVDYVDLDSCVQGTAVNGASAGRIEDP